MGGFGSGRRFRFDKQTTTDDVKKIEIWLLRRSGALHGLSYWHRRGTLTWSRGERETGAVSYEITHDSFILRFGYQHGNESWQDIEQTVWFDRSDCHFGGERLWFLCPECDDRIGVLYLGGSGFLCRDCYRLPYASQRESYGQRMWRKARTIRERLGAPRNLRLPIWGKPRGMHWKTFERLRQRESLANNQGTLAWIREADAFIKRNSGKGNGNKQTVTKRQSVPYRKQQ